MSLLPALILLAACGGGGGGEEGGTPPPAPLTIEITSEAGLDGYMPPNPPDVAGSTLKVGDGMSNEFARAFVSFPLGLLPTGARIESAELELVQVTVSGGQPYIDLGTLVVDALDYGPVLDLGDFLLSASLPGLGVLSASATLEPKRVDVTTAVVADVAAARFRSQFRLRFSTDTDGDNDMDLVTFASGDAATGQPRLRIVYRPAN